ncbi:MAG: gamma-glutamyl-gamma-aminobutyrate hydrolase family protein [Chloroflexi bacterium]|nr:gamma-glutamyl-gamma-aminobutyrate hydrolase family protein [Chloroflexota bacterium]
MPPLIGITTSSFIAPATGWAYNRTYVGCIQAITDAGGLPVLIPVSINSETRRQLYDRLDGVLLTGGEDVTPALYGAEPHPALGRTDPDRDRAELELARWSVADDRPLFCICRGHQLLNVALGGTLLQDIPSLVRTTINHDAEQRNALIHEVEIDSSSRLAAILGATRVPVNSLHHQAVDVPAPNLCVTAFAPDGIIEGAELPDRRFVLSVQWHPEDLFRDYAVMRRLFRAFVEAAGGNPAP